MSFQAMTWAVNQKTQKPIDKLLLLMLANYTNQDGESWTSQDRLADDMSTTSRTIRNAMKRLEDGYFIQRSPRYDHAGRRTSDIIKLLPEKNTPPKSTTRSYGKDNPLPEKNASTTGKKCSSLPEDISGEPVIEPVIEPKNPHSPPLGDDTDLFRDVNTDDKTEDQSPKQKQNASSVDDYPESFVEFWLAYPRKKGKGSRRECSRKWKNLSKKLQAEVMLGVEEYARQCEDKKTEDKFIKLPATYLNVKNRHWEAHVEEANGVDLEEEQKQREIFETISHWSVDRWWQTINILQENQNVWPSFYGPPPGNKGTYCPIVPNQPVGAKDVINGQFVR